MITIVEPKQQYSVLWSSPKELCNKYRLMHYVLIVNHRGRVLLHNVVTGQLVVLDQNEADLLERLPLDYCPGMRQLIDGHFLVPEHFDEHNQVVKMREVLRKLHAAQLDSIRAYTILPTTGCNARCYYCFENSVKPITMTERTANDIIDYIVEHCGGKSVHLNWFGGEPTLAARRIDQICEGLRERGIQFQSNMVTNGYLFDEKMVDSATRIWNLYHVQISVDGTEKNNNFIKDFVHAQDNPYQRVLRNVGILLNNRVNVTIRMNFDIGNADDFANLVSEVQERFEGTKGLAIYATPVLGEYADKKGIINHGNDEWLVNKIVELNDIARKAGIARTYRALPCLEFVGCSAEDDSYMLISPDGSLARCLELFEGMHVVGNVQDGITNETLLHSWKIIADYGKCKECVYFPRCVKMQNCPAGDRCYHLDRNMQIELAIREQYDNFLERKEHNYEV